MANRSKAKGSRGEVEVMELIQSVVNEEYASKSLPAPELSRSPHGRDIVGLPWLAPEIKRHEPPKVPGSNNRLGELTPAQVSAFWAQCKDQATRGGTNREPVLFYRMNNRPWNVRMFGFLALPEVKPVCPRCEGKGQVPAPSFAGLTYIATSCGSCQGKGTLEVSQPAVRVRCPVDITVEAFLAYLRLRIRQELDSPVRL